MRKYTKMIWAEMSMMSRENIKEFISDLDDREDYYVKGGDKLFREIPNYGELLVAGPSDCIVKSNGQIVACDRDILNNTLSAIAFVPGLLVSEFKPATNFDKVFGREDFSIGFSPLGKKEFESIIENQVCPEYLEKPRKNIIQPNSSTKPVYTVHEIKLHPDFPSVDSLNDETGFIAFDNFYKPNQGIFLYIHLPMSGYEFIIHLRTMNILVKSSDVHWVGGDWVVWDKPTQKVSVSHTEIKDLMI